MRRCICILLLLICFVSCSKGQSNDYSKEIIGCWKFYNEYYEIESNYPFIDTLVSEIQNKDVEEGKNNPYIIKFINNHVSYFLENGKPIDNPAHYQINGDSIIVQGVIRKDDKLTSEITIINDTLCIKANTPRAFKNSLRDLKWNKDIILPIDLKLKKMIRYTICVRVKDCDQYQE